MICVNILKAGPKGILVWKTQLIALILLFKHNYGKGES